MPLIAIASRSGIFYGIAVIDRQMKRGDTIAAIGSGSGIYIIARGGVGLAIPRVCIACGSGELSMLGAIDRQGENLEAITTMDCLGLVLVST